jgi:alginate O-acetyltransferase complex protein AlgI
MLFNSYTFIFLFLPLTLVLFFFISRRLGPRAAAVMLALSSLLFYAWSGDSPLVLMLSIVMNFIIGRALTAAPRQIWLLTAGVGANLLVVAYFKYASFLAGTLQSLLGWPNEVPSISLLAGISFFTFTQIAFLVDAYRAEAREYSFVNYALFVTYFPHLIAGPILHHKEMMPQFENKTIYSPRADQIALGLGIFSIGLFKKVVLADGIKKLADPAFGIAAQGGSPNFVDAWIGALAYTLEIYFDFSGYSDMAIGLAQMMGVRLPLNFDSPYKARNIVEFWKRWHITLSRFLRDYLYIPLGGNRRGPPRRYVNLLATMLIGGLWHGASWTFVLWGGLHGIYLVVNHLWRSMV